MPAADQQARALLFGNINPQATINVHCQSTSDRLADEFRTHGFSRVNSFEAVASETWES